MSEVLTSFGEHSFLPIEARAPFYENLEWKTDITPSYNGGESRVCLLQRARQSFEATYPVRFRAAPDVYNTVYGSLVNQWLIPCWGEAQYVGPVPTGAMSLPVGSAAADLRAGSLALLWGGNCGGYAVITLTAVDAVSVSFDPIDGLNAPVYLVPLRRGRIDNVRKRTAGYDAQWSAVYEVDDTIDLAPAMPDQYLGEDIYFDDNLVQEDSLLSERIFTEVHRADYEVGPVRISTPWTGPRTSRPFGMFAGDAAEAWALRLWLHRRQGRYRAFWQPSFESDLRLTHAGAVAATLTVRADAWPELASRRTHLAIETTAGWLPREILSAITDGDNVHLELSSAVGMDSSQIKRISYLGLRRLDSDSVTLQWIGGGCCQLVVPTVELSP